jgi:hypothetical protein
MSGFYLFALSYKNCNFKNICYFNVIEIFEQFVEVARNLLRKVKTSKDGEDSKKMSTLPS